MFGGAGGTGAPPICPLRGPLVGKANGRRSGAPEPPGRANPVAFGSEGQIRDQSQTRIALCVLSVGRSTRRPEAVPRTDVSTAARSCRCCHLQIARPPDRGVHIVTDRWRPQSHEPQMGSPTGRGQRPDEGEREGERERRTRTARHGRCERNEQCRSHRVAERVEAPDRRPGPKPGSSRRKGRKDREAGRISRTTIPAGSGQPTPIDCGRFMRSEAANEVRTPARESNGIDRLALTAMPYRPQTGRGFERERSIDRNRRSRNGAVRGAA